MFIPWEKSYDQRRQHIQKQRHYFANKGPSKAMVFLVVMYGCKSWTVKKENTQGIILPLLDGKKTKSDNTKL